MFRRTSLFVVSCCVVLSQFSHLSGDDSCIFNKTDVDCAASNSESCPACGSAGAGIDCSGKIKVYTGNTVYTIETTAAGEGSYKGTGSSSTVECKAEYGCKRKRVDEKDCDGGSCNKEDDTRNCFFCEKGTKVAGSESKYSVLPLVSCEGSSS